MNKWNFYTSKQLKPKGWLKRQLEIQAKGLSGNLDKVWRDVKDSAWIGGDAEGWERVPYWLDGFIPLAYLLENEDMIKRAQKYIDAILSYQKPSGWICPCDEDKIPTYDTWAVQLISKVLVVYYECSLDPRIPSVIYRIMKNYYELLSSCKIQLFNWGKFRWFEAFIAINFLKKRYDEPWIIDLAKILKEQGVDYSKLTNLWKTPIKKWTFETHIVNLAMMLKYEVLSCDILGEEYIGLANNLETILTEYNGTPVGVFTGDECLSGLSPIQGTELCAVVEQMYSYEHLLAYTGDSKWAELLELIAFNALPATISDDMWAHQYDQLSNQISCEKFVGRPIFSTNGDDANVFGLEPNYGCCTANFNQGWPKFTLSSFMYNGDTVFSAVPIPSKLETDDFNIILNTNYPFENRFEYIVNSSKNLRLKVRIPSFAKNIKVNGNNSCFIEELNFDILANENTTVNVEFDIDPTLVLRPYNLRTVKYGSLVFSLPIEYKERIVEYEKDKVVRKYPYCDYEYLPQSEWNYAYSSPFFEVERKKITNTPFSSKNPPIILKAKVKNIAWGFESGYLNLCAKVPSSTIPLSEEKTVKLYPYGSAKLRLTELPLI